jgi:hypothetical protein
MPTSYYRDYSNSVWLHEYYLTFYLDCSAFQVARKKVRIVWLAEKSGLDNILFSDNAIA